MKGAKWAIILIFLSTLALGSCAGAPAVANKDKIIGKWIPVDSQGKKGSLVFDKFGYAKLNPKEGIFDDNFLKGISLKYKADYSSDPNTLDLLFCDENSGEVIGEEAWIFKFITPDKIKIGFSKNKTRPEGFDSIDKEETEIFIRVKE